uniref:SHSP domain-containing protein n=1 Tax=Panagrolaimus sp. JU765 TaxID=591449 RepID=A0AC34Q567_9BILA
MTSIPVGHDWVGQTWDWPLQHSDGVVKVTNTADKFEVGLDVQFFTPNEIEVKVSGNELLIHCRHEVRNDLHGSVAREIHRAYKLPADVDASSLKSHLSSRGVLNISAQKKK